MDLPLDAVMSLLAGLPQPVLAVSETLVALPAVALCVVACGEPDGTHAPRLRAAVPVATALLVVEGLACAWLGAPTWPLCSADTLAFIPLLAWASGLSLGRTAFVVMTNVFVAAVIVYCSAVVDALAVGDELSAVYLAWPGLLNQWVMWALALPWLWHATKRIMPGALASPVVDPRAWRTLWLRPTLLTLAIQLLRPGYVETFQQTRVARDALVFMAMVTVLVALTYLQMWRLLSLAEKRLRAERELHGTELANEQVAHLDERIEASRRMRHDLRHHVHALQALLDKGDVVAARSYLGELDGTLRADEAPIRYCDNLAVNAALVYYCDAARNAGARVDVGASVPGRLEQRQSDVVAVASNLLENAVNALRQQADAGRGPLALRVRMESRADGLYMTVDNSCLPERVRMVGGEFVSMQPGSHGLGLRSVREVAERTGGVARFQLDGSTFRASVMLGVER